ncbi:MAG TPA: class I SAM-dependent methyltransferase [Ktedonobacterales bacterium]
MHEFIRDLLQCPQCGGGLAWSVTVRQGERIVEGEAQCAVCAATYPIHEGIGLFLTPDLPRNDLWEQAGSRLTGYLRDHPDVERRLMDVPPETLGPADLFFRAAVLEDRGDYAHVRELLDRAHEGLYTEEYRNCLARELSAVVERLRIGDEPIVDLACGRGVLVERLAEALDRPIIATDFSPRILRRNRRWLEYWGLYDRVSLLGFDARRTPFKNGVIRMLTTNLGLPNIEEPARLLEELRRIVSGTLLAISHFYPENDALNAAEIRAAKLDTMLYLRPTLDAFKAAGWQVSLEDRCIAHAQPTPAGAVIEGASIDSLPVAPTALEWGVLVAR